MTFFDKTPKDKIPERKLISWVSLKLKCFGSVKDTVRRMKRQSTDLEISFAKHTFCGIVSKYTKSS